MTVLDDLLNATPVSRLRRNHGLEHATLHVLSKRHPHQSMAGHSDVGGFWILGDLDTGDVESAVDEALSRMHSGEHNLSVHPNCGTNFVTAGAIAGGAAWLGMLGTGRSARDKIERLPLVIGLATLALIFGQPLGLALQANVTTSGYPGELEVVDIVASHRGRVKAHRVVTRG